MRSKHLPYVGVALTSLLVGACEDVTGTLTSDAQGASYSDVPWAGDSELAGLLASVRAATDPYHDVAVARAAGYRPSSAGCEDSDEGAMGIHYGNAQLLGLVRTVPPPPKPYGTDAVIDPLRPEVLLYEPEEDGTLRLVGIEYVVYRAAWDAVNPEPPTLLDIPFDQKFGVEAHGHEDHYELHVWLWRHNPLGTFYPWNPKVRC